MTKLHNHLATQIKPNYFFIFSYEEYFPLRPHSDRMLNARQRSNNEFVGGLECEEMGSGSSFVFMGGLECEKMLEDMLLDDNQVAYGEISLMPMVNSLECLQQMNHAAASNSHNITSYVEGPNDGKHIQLMILSQCKAMESK